MRQGKLPMLLYANLCSEQKRFSQLPSWWAYSTGHFMVDIVFLRLVVPMQTEFLGYLGVDPRYRGELHPNHATSSLSLYHGIHHRHCYHLCANSAGR